MNPDTQYCADCGVDLMPDSPIGSRDWERYMVHDEVWAAAGMERNGGWLCIGDLTARLRRPLTGADLIPWLPINRPYRDDDTDRLAVLKMAAHRAVIDGTPYRKRMPAGAVDVSRPTRWQNPFPVARYGLDLALALHRRWLQGDPLAVAEARAAGCRLRMFGEPLVRAARMHLRERVLACWCPLDQRCHADLLLAVARGEAP